MGDDVPEAMLRTAYVGILDPITRTHLTNFQGKTTKPEELKQEILRFVSNAVIGSSAMYIGSFDNGGTDVPYGDVGYPESETAAEDWAGYEEVNAIGKGGYWQWPGKGKAKAKARAKKKDTTRDLAKEKAKERANEKERANKKETKRDL